MGYITLQGNGKRLLPRFMEAQPLAVILPLSCIISNNYKMVPAKIAVAWNDFYVFNAWCFYFAQTRVSKSFSNIALMWSLWFQVDDRRTGIRRANVEHKWVLTFTLHYVTPKLLEFIRKIMKYCNRCKIIKTKTINFTKFVVPGCLYFPI